ncbi:MAG: cytochrome c3 family protein [Myxococcota bacterium]
MRAHRLTPALLLVAVLLAGASGCLSPEARHRVLTTLLDGVPPLHAEAVEPSVPEHPAPAERGPARRPVEPVWVLHDPYAGKECEECHDEVRSNRLLRKGQALCWTCHDREDFEGEVVHGPMAAGECLACHDAHRSHNESLLVRPGTALCEGCHDLETFAELERHREERGKDCVGCHNPHASDREYMLEDEVGRS